jgi:hypothetical protein
MDTLFSSPPPPLFIVLYSVALSQCAGGASKVLTYIYAITLSHQDCLMFFKYQMINTIYATIVNDITLVDIA